METLGQRSTGVDVRPHPGFEGLRRTVKVDSNESLFDYYLIHTVSKS